MDLLYIFVAIGFLGTAYLVLHKFSSMKPSGYVVEILAAVVGAVITVSAMLIMIKLQAKQEKEKEFSTRLFQQKLMLYRELLLDIFKMDDDGIIDAEEVQHIENVIGTACLVAGQDLVMMFSQFMWQLKLFGKIYPKNLDETHKNAFVEHLRKHPEYHFKPECKDLTIYELSLDEIPKYYVSLDDLVNAMRDDLGVVQGTVRETIGHFVNMNYNEQQLIKSPNIEVTGYDISESGKKV